MQETGRKSAGVYVSELPFREALILRGDASDAQFRSAIEQQLRVALPIQPNTFENGSSFSILWLGPTEWLIIASTSEHSQLSLALSAALRGTHSAVVDVSHGHAILRIRGERALDVLSKGCSLNLSPSAFFTGRCAQTLVAKAAVVLCCIDATPTIDVIVRRSFADYLALWLADAAEEYGVEFGTSELTGVPEGVRAQTQRT